MIYCYLSTGSPGAEPRVQCVGMPGPSTKEWGERAALGWWAWFMLFNVCYCTGDVASCWLNQYTSPISDESSKRSLRKKWMFVEFLEDVLSEQRTLEFHMGRMVLWWAWWVNGSTGLWQNHFHQWHRMLLSPTWRPFSSCQRFRIATSLSSVLGYWGIKRFLAVLGMQSENHLPTEDAANIDR